METRGVESRGVEREGGRELIQLSLSGDLSLSLVSTFCLSSRWRPLPVRCQRSPRMRALASAERESPQRLGLGRSQRKPPQRKPPLDKATPRTKKKGHQKKGVSHLKAPSQLLHLLRCAGRWERREFEQFR